MTSASPKPLHTRLRAALRMLWLRSPERAAAVRAGRVGRGQYRCSRCEALVGPKGFQIDHDPACGGLRSLDDVERFTRTLFLGRQVVMCRECHAIKTKEDRRVAAKRN